MPVFPCFCAEHHAELPVACKRRPIAAAHWSQSLSCYNSRTNPTTRNFQWYHAACLIGLLAIAGFLRLKNINRYSIWRDESWAIYLATGRGDALFNMPFQTLVTSPPNVGFDGAPHWWHIWNTLDGVTHPPGYYVALRWWVDLFGQSDLAIHSMSVFFDLAAILVLFDALWLFRGPWCGLAAAAMMTFAPMQIDFSQEARPYTLIVFLGLVICDIVLRIERRGGSRTKLAALSIFVAAEALTHYFAAGIIVGAGIYAVVRLRGSARRNLIIAFAASLLFAAIVWAPFVSQSRAAFHNSMGFSEPNASLLKSFVNTPERLLVNDPEKFNWAGNGALAILVYALPLLDRRKLLWWLWTALSIACLLILDLSRHSVVMEIDRYIFIASAGVYAILAIPLPGRIGILVPILAVAITMIAGVARFQAGPKYAVGSVYMWEEDRQSAAFLRTNLRPGDAVVITTNIVTYAEFTYVAIAHYNGQWQVPVVLLRTPLDDRTRQQLFAYQRVWVLGQDPIEDTKRLLPGCKIADLGESIPFDSVWRIK